MQMTLYPKWRHKDAAVIKAITKSRDVHCPLNNSDAFMRLKKLNQRRERVAMHNCVVV